MSVDRSLYDEQLNFYSRHTRGDPTYTLNSLYFQIGRELPDIDIEFPKGTPNDQNRILDSQQLANDRQDSINFDKYEAMLKSERQQALQKNSLHDGAISYDKLKEQRDRQQPNTEELVSSREPVNEELNRSHDQIPIEEIFDKGQEPSNVVNQQVEISQSKEADLERILSEGLLEDPKLDDSPTHPHGDLRDDWRPQAIPTPDEAAGDHIPTTQPIHHTQELQFALQPPPAYQPNAHLPPQEPEMIEIARSVQPITNPPAQILSPRSETKYTQTNEQRFEQAVKQAVLRESSLESNQQESKTPRKIPFRAAKKELAEKRKKKKEQAAPVASEADSSSSPHEVKPKPQLQIDLPISLTTAASAGQGAKKSFSKTFLNKSPINKLTNGHTNFPSTTTVDSASTSCPCPEPTVSEKEKKRLLSSFFASNS